MSDKKVGPADRLIGAASKGGVDIPCAAKREIEKILEYNDGVPRSRCVSRKQVVQMLTDDFGLKIGKDSFDNWLRAEFGRGWSG